LNRIVNYLLPRFRDILFLAVFSAAMAAGWRTLNGDGDLPRHLLMGRVILETHSIPTKELFSYVYEGRTFVAHEWLADVIYYTFYALLGFKGVVFLTAILITGSFFTLYLTLSSQTEERLLLFVLVLWGVIASYWHWVARPHLFSMLFFALWLAGVDTISRGKYLQLWLLPALMLIWANTHAEFVSGFLVLAAYAAGWFWDWLFHREAADWNVIKRLGQAAGLSAIASLINPFGFETWRTILGYLDNSYLMSLIRETRAPDFSSSLFSVEFGLILASIVILGLQRGSIRSAHVFLLAGFTALALRSGRNIHLYSLVAPFVLAGPLVQIAEGTIWQRVTSAIAKIEGQLKGILWPVATVAIFLALILTGKIGKDYILDPKFFPVQAVEWLEGHPQDGHMYNEFLWGGYIVWNLWPGQKDFIDSQTDYTGEATREYMMVQDLDENWPDVFKRYDVQWVIIRTDSSLSRELMKDGWIVLYQDSTAIILRQIY
jgi:hypothetical protein